MSSTNRGAVRNPRDLYRTPLYTIRAILPYVQWDKVGTLLEPCCGDGRIIKEAKREHKKIGTLGMDLVPDGSEYIAQDYLKYIYHPPFSLILTNPPFSLAQEFITKAVIDASCVIMLLRLNYLGSQKRHKWWQKHLPTHVFALSRRPDFTGEGGDSCDYGWFVWDRSTSGLITKPQGMYVI